MQIKKTIKKEIFKEVEIIRQPVFPTSSKSDPVKGALVLPVLLGVVSNGNGKEVLWDYCVCVLH